MIRWFRERVGDAVLAVASVVCGIAMLVAAERLPEVATFRDVGPAFFPEIVGWGFVASGVLMLVIARPRRIGGFGGQGPVAAEAAPSARDPSHGVDEAAPQPRLDHPWPRFAAAIAVTAAYVFLLPRFGFLWTTVPFLFGMGVVFGSRRVVVNAGTAVIATAFLYLVFRVWLRVPLPM